MDATRDNAGHVRRRHLSDTRNATRHGTTPPPFAPRRHTSTDAPEMPLFRHNGHAAGQRDGRTRETAGNATETRDNATPRATPPDTSTRTDTDGMTRRAAVVVSVYAVDKGHAQRTRRRPYGGTGRENGTNHVIGEAGRRRANT